MAKLPQHLASSIHGLAKQAIGKDWQLYSILLQNWREIVGAEWAGQTRPVRLAFPHQSGRRSGTLTISLPRGLAMAAQYQQPHILARINGFFGRDTVTRLAFIHAALPPPAPPPPPLAEAAKAAIAATTAPVAHDELRQSLASLGQALALEAQTRNACQSK